MKTRCAFSSPGDDGRAIVVGASTQTDVRAEVLELGPVRRPLRPRRPDPLGLPRRWNSDVQSGRRWPAPTWRAPLALYLADHPTARPTRSVEALACTATIGHVERQMGYAQRAARTRGPDRHGTPAPARRCRSSGIGRRHRAPVVADGGRRAVPIEQFKIYRGTASGRETLLVTPSRDHVELRRPHRSGGDLVLPDQGIRPGR